MTRTSSHRRGSVYVVVLGAAMIVATIALAASSMGRLALRNANDQRDRRQAQIAARSGVEFALGWINGNSNWRTQLINGAESQELTSNNVRFTWSVADVYSNAAEPDTDDDLADDVLDHAVVRAVGKCGTARSVLTVIVEPFDPAAPKQSAASCLESVLHAIGPITFGSDASVQRNGEVTSSDTNSPYLSQTARSMPGDHVFDYYVSRGTWIPITDLPTVAGRRQFTLRVLSRNLNPFGEPNPWGIYVIDCQEENVDLSLCRVYGTLVLLNAGPTTAISNVAILQPEALNYPSLMVDGNLSINLKHADDGAILRESIISYNPPGAPFVGESATDTDTFDSRTATLDGVVYVTGAVTFTDDAVIRGSLVAGSVTINSGKVLTLEYRPYARDYPPPGFTSGSGVRPLPGSWREVGL